ncbi:MAG: carbon-nitrogen family hydrolase [Acidimicrobiales bacterium]|nr:carbon-nitrogen family hydrolase [Acidimicrobiales bacterium]
MRVVGVQHQIDWHDPEATMSRVSPQIEGAVAAGADLVCLTEMFSTGFSMDTDSVVEPVDGPSSQFLARSAAQASDMAGRPIHLVASVPTVDPEAHAELPVNRLFVFGPVGLIGTYDKLHPFSLSGEDKYYAAGSAPLTLTIQGVRVSFFVCFDLRFAYSFWDLALDTDLYVIVANWPASRRLHWQTLLRARAIENLAYVLGVNRVGDDGNGFGHAGDSVLLSPRGETLASAAEIETLVIGDIDPGVVAGTRERFGFLNDRKR